MAVADKGLRNRVVVVTRDEATDGPLGSELRQRGATVFHWPSVRISPPLDPRPLDHAVQRLGAYDWVVFTSARAVTAVLERLGDGSGDPPAHVSASRDSLKVAAVGAGTARTLRTAGWPVHVEPGEHSSVALVRELGAEGMEGRSVLFPASSLAGRALVQGLRELGAEVDEVVAYRTERLSLPAEALERIEGVDAVCFASPSAIEAWLDALGMERFSGFGRELLVAAIGPTTAAALRSAGCLEVSVARESTFPGLADVLEEEFTRRAGP